MLSIKDQDLFTVVSVIFTYSLNLAICYFSIIYVNTVGSHFIHQLFKICKIEQIMAKMEIPYSVENLFRFTMKLILSVLPILLILFFINFTLAELMGIVYPYVIRVIYMGTAAQMATGGLQMAPLFVKMLKNLKKDRGQYKLDEQIEIMLTATELILMYQDVFKSFNDIYGILFFVNIYANSLEMAFLVGYIYLRGAQDTSILTWLIMYIPGNLIHFYLYSCFQEVITRVSIINKY